MTTNPQPMVIGLLDDDLADLDAKRRILVSAGHEVRPFTDPNTFFEYARNHSPHVAIVGLGGPNGLEVAARLREVSPPTSVMISLKIHHGRARRVLPRNEFLNLIESRGRGGRLH